MKQQFSLFLAFFRVGLFGFGGGPASIPLVHKEVVEKYKWMDDQDFSDLLALSNTLPGPIVTKMAGHIGYRVSGFFGLLVAVLASIVPTIFLMIILLTSLSAFSDEPWIAGMTRAVLPVVGVMMAILTWQFFQKAEQGLGWLTSLALVAGSLVLLEWLHISPAILIVTLLLFVLVKPTKKSGQKNDGKKRQGGSG